MYKKVKSKKNTAIQTEKAQRPDSKQLSLVFQSRLPSSHNNFCLTQGRLALCGEHKTHELFKGLNRLCEWSVKSNVVVVIGLLFLLLERLDETLQRLSRCTFRCCLGILFITHFSSSVPMRLQILSNNQIVLVARALYHFPQAHKRPVLPRQGAGFGVCL